MSSKTVVPLFALLLSWGAVLCLSFATYFGTFSAGVEYVTGRRLSLDPQHISLGRMDAGCEYEACVHIKNASDRTVTLLGATTFCPCSVISDMPTLLGPGQSRELVLVVDGRGRGGSPVNGRVTILTDHPAQPALILKLEGAVASGAQKEGPPG